MTRKIQIDLVDAIGTFMTKTNQLSDYIGDLDNLDSAFVNNFADSNIVSSLNYLSDKLDSIGNVLFGSGGNLYVTGFIGDSAEFKRLRVGELTADSAEIDSATIGDLYVTGTMFADSAYFQTINVDSIGVAAGAILTIDSATISKLNVTSLTIDSATVNRLSAGFADIDSAQIDSATITDLTVTTLIIDSNRYELDNAKRFTVKNDGGTIVLDGYFLSTSDTANIA
jgi:hypothetical protein